MSTLGPEPLTCGIIAAVGGVRRAITTAAAISILAVSGDARAGEPPNQNDPCSNGGRNTCGTTGTGYYADYQYGLRWFGDYRGVVPNESHTYCIDLRYWYPAPRHQFREDTSDVLRNRDGETVSLESKRRIAYAIWEYGRSSKREPGGRGDALRPRADGRRAPG